ncbi:MAG: peptide deformylase [Victivallaceae bacterium]
MFFRHKSKFNVYTYGSATLKQPAAPVREITDEIREIATEMLTTMKLFDGIGLAAPQIGIHKQIVTLGIPFESISKSGGSPGEALLLPRMPMVLINPEIIAFGEELADYDEGCLSVPEIYAPVERPLLIIFRAQAIGGELIECECGGLLSRCIQHEIDHLGGILFVDRLKPDALNEVKDKLDRLEKSGGKKDFKRTISM